MNSMFEIKNLKLKVLTLILLNIQFSIAQQGSPAAKQGKSILLKGGVAHLGNGKVIENSLIGFKEGKLSIVADAGILNTSDLKFDEIIDIKGKQIYPGFIAPNSTLGLVEIDEVRASQDFKDIGSILPHVRSIIAYNTDSKIIPTVRSNGVLMTQVTPRAGLISGTSSIVELDGWNWEDAVYKIDDGIHLNWPRTIKLSGGMDPLELDKNKEINKQIIELTKFFKDALAYEECKVQEEKNLRLEAMKGLFDGRKTLFIHANYVKEISEAINFSKSMQVKKMVIVGGKDSWMLTDLLKENNVSVMVSRLHDLPEKPEDDIDLPFKLPYLLQKAGVLFCLNNEGEMEAMGTRNLPFYAGTAIAYGLTREEAIMAISSNTAKILGIDARIGTIEVGKDATIIISTGDALNMKTNNIELAYLRGKSIALKNNQQELYEKYKKKYGMN